MSAKKSASKVSELAKKLIDDYIQLKAEGLDENQLKTIIQRIISPTDVSSVRLYLEESIDSDATTIKGLSESIRENMKKPFIFEDRIYTDDTILESELKKLNEVTNLSKIEMYLTHYRTACMILNKNQLRLSKYTEARQRVYDIVSAMMPSISKLPSDI